MWSASSCETGTANTPLFSTQSSRPAHVQILLSPSRAPKVNAICERVVGALRRDLLDRLLVSSEAHAVKVLTEYHQHYNGHRPHQSRWQLPPDRPESPAPAVVSDLQVYRIRRQQVLGGLINEYRRVV
ncbi:integrase core domain-containing protein [Streptomyces sp. NPDC054871]